MESPSPLNVQDQLDPKRKTYQEALKTLTKAKYPFLVGGAYALHYYTGIWRDTKDLDIFTLPQDFHNGLKILAEAGFDTHMTFPHWLGKASHGEHQIDVIFSSGNAIGRVDKLWFEYSTSAEILGVDVQISPVEEMIWSKAFVMERERYDGADIVHLVRACAESIDWDRMIDRFGVHWRVLLSHLLLFGFVYPAEQFRIPQWLIRDLLDRLEIELTSAPPQERICQGTLLSREQYSIDIEQWGYSDARLFPLGAMTEGEISQWSAEAKS
jgi:hypothetical protein